MWYRIDNFLEVPGDRDLRLAVIDTKGNVHALVFACRREGDKWKDAVAGRLLEVFPTHWQDW